jgi:hypothetical protein
MAMTEGGWTPGAQAGGGDRIDIRYPKATPDTVAAWTLEAFNTQSPLEFMTPWLLASNLMRGEGWEGDCWVTGTYHPQGYDTELPVVRALQGVPPPPPPPKTVREHVLDAKTEIGQALEALAQIGEP